MLANALSRSTVFKYAHPEVLSAFANKKLGRHTIEIINYKSDQSFLNYAEFSGLGLVSICYASEVKIRSPELEKMFHLQLVTEGECKVTFKDARVILRQGDAIMLNPNEPIELDYSFNCKKLIIKIPESAVQFAVLSDLGCVPKSGICFERSPVNFFRFPSLINLFEAVFLEIEDYEADIFCAFDPYKEIVVRKLLRTFSSNVQQTKGSIDIPPRMKKVIQYIDENIKDNIDLEELADVSKVSVRTIYNMFSASFSSTPRGYIKKRKLQRIREELLSGSARNVTEAALDYGFVHFGRLSCDYKKLFGELPSETKRAIS